MITDARAETDTFDWVAPGEVQREHARQTKAVGSLQLSAKDYEPSLRQENASWGDKSHVRHRLWDNTSVKIITLNT